MCSFEGERTAVVCDATIDYVRREADRAFGDKVRYSLGAAQGTKVQVPPDVESSTFEMRIRAAIGAAQAASR